MGKAFDVIALGVVVLLPVYWLAGCVMQGMG